MGDGCAGAANAFACPREKRYFGAMTEKTAAAPTLHRAPMRKRGIERFEFLLDATAALIADNPDADISLAHIAERAGVPIASVYHFFPNRNAVFVALAQRYHRQISEMLMVENNEPPERWQALFEFRLSRSAQFLNANPAALRLFMGAGVSAEVRNADVAGNAELARQRAAYLRHHYLMAPMPDLEKRLAIALALIDGIWALSYSNHRMITDEYVQEAVRASLMYLRCYLPEHMQRAR
jgi:AcrR family transcriptional regulator